MFLLMHLCHTTSVYELCFFLSEKNTDSSAVDIIVLGIKVLQNSNLQMHFMYHRDKSRYSFIVGIRTVYDLVVIYTRHFKVLNVIWNLFCYFSLFGMYLQYV